MRSNDQRSLDNINYKREILFRNGNQKDIQCQRKYGEVNVILAPLCHSRPGDCAMIAFLLFRASEARHGIQACTRESGEP